MWFARLIERQLNSLYCFVRAHSSLHHIQIFVDSWRLVPLILYLISLALIWNIYVLRTTFSLYLQVTEFLFELDNFLYQFMFKQVLPCFNCFIVITYFHVNKPIQLF